MSKTVEDIGTLKINLLSQAQYDAEKAGGRLADDELYLTPSSGTGVSDVEVNGESVVSGGVAEITINDIPSGGTTGQVLTKDSGTDYDVSWEDPSGGTITDVTVDGTSIVDDGVAELDTATQLRDGLMTALDKQKLDGIASGAEVNVQSDWNQSTNTADDYIKNKPTIPTVNNATLTIQKNGTTVKTFTANASSNVTANITVPTQASDIGAQPTLVSGTNIKTINSESLLGSGNITLSAEDEIFYCVYGTTTLAEAVTAYNAGKTLICKYTDLAVFYAPLVSVSVLNGSVEGFAFSVGGYGSSISFLLSSSGWTLSEMSATSTPTANKLPLFDANAQMNSTDMTSADVSSFVAGLNTTVGDYVQRSELADYVVDQGTSGIWTYRKWNSGIAECWGSTSVPSTTYSANGGYKNVIENLPSGLFNTPPSVVIADGNIDSVIATDIGFTAPNNTASVQTYLINRYGSSVTKTGVVFWQVKGTWK